MVLEAIQKKEVKLVILANDASANTKKQFLNKCAYYTIPIVSENFTREEISQAIGKVRTVCAFEDEGFARSFQKLQQK